MVQAIANDVLKVGSFSFGLMLLLERMPLGCIKEKK
jgi:hypothetical protein